MKFKGVFFVILAIILVFSIVGGMATTMISGSESITTANTCSIDTGVNGESYTYNTTTTLCDNSTTKGVADRKTTMPLNTLFGSNGVVLLVFMAALLIFAIGIALKKAKK